MMRPDDPAQRRTLKIVFLCAGVGGGIGFVLIFLPLVYTFLFLAVVIPLGAVVRWRWGEAIDRWMHDLFEITDED